MSWTFPYGLLQKRTGRVTHQKWILGAFWFFKFQVTTLPILPQSFARGSLWRTVTNCHAVEQWIMVNLFQWSDCETHFAYTSQMLVGYEVIILHVARFIDSVNLLPSLGELTLTRFILSISVSNICPSRDLVSHLLAPEPGPNHARHAMFHLRVQSWHPIASSFLVALGTVVSPNLPHTCHTISILANETSAAKEEYFCSRLNKLRPY